MRPRTPLFEDEHLCSTWFTASVTTTSTTFHLNLLAMAHFYLHDFGVLALQHICPTQPELHRTRSGSRNVTMVGYNIARKARILGAPPT